MSTPEQDHLAALLREAPNRHVADHLAAWLVTRGVRVGAPPVTSPDATASGGSNSPAQVGAPPSPTLREAAQRALDVYDGIRDVPLSEIIVAMAALRTALQEEARP